jgi:hypothetical protein
MFPFVFSVLWGLSAFFGVFEDVSSALSDLSCEASEIASFRCSPVHFFPERVSGMAQERDVSRLHQKTGEMDGGSIHIRGI